MMGVYMVLKGIMRVQGGGGAALTGLSALLIALCVFGAGKLSKDD